LIVAFIALYIFPYFHNVPLIINNTILAQQTYGKIMLMKGMTVTFIKKVAAGTDDLNNPTYTTQSISIDDVLIAPITEPANARETQALEQQRDQVRVHLPKATNQDISDSSFVYDGKTFKVDSDSVKFMDENTPTRWNRYLRAECVNG
jgi:hypothetical protein